MGTPQATFDSKVQESTNLQQKIINSFTKENGKKLISEERRGSFQKNKRIEKLKQYQNNAANSLSSNFGSDVNEYDINSGKGAKKHSDLDSSLSP